MNDLVTDEMREQVAKALADDWNPERNPVLTAMFRDYAATALEAAAPLIAAKAWDQGYVASQLEWEHAYDGHIIDPDVSDDMCIECGQGNPYRKEKQ